MNHDIELQVWKDLATSKQILITAIIETLGMDPDCTSGDLRLAINLLKERADESEKQSAHLESGQEHLNRVIEEKDEQIASATTEVDIAMQHLDDVKAISAAALNKAKDLVNQKQKELKAINKILSDSPENVVKKMKKLKQKNIEQTKRTKDIEKKFKEAVRLCEKLRVEIENRVVENKQLKAEVNKLVDPNPKPSDNSDSI